MPTSFSYEIVEHIEVLSSQGNTSKELNLVSYNGGAPKYDLRTWQRDEDGSEKMFKGITLNEEEAQLLRDALVRVLGEKGL